MGGRLVILLAALVSLSGCGDAPAAEITPGSNPALTVTDVDQTATPPSNTGANNQYSGFAKVIAHHQRLSNRVARISRRLRVANASLCDLTRPDVGLSTHRLSDYPEPLQPLAQHFIGIGAQGRFIRSVVPDSPADRAGLRVGEQILGGWPIRDDQPLTLRGPDAPQTIRLDPDRACHIPTFVIQAEEMNAATDGREIDLSTSLIEAVGDDDALALIIAHEMAHVIRGHTRDQAGWATELMADGDALILMRNANYDIETTVASWASGIEAHRQSQALSRTHPPVDIRLQNLQNRLRDISNRGPGFLYLE